MSTRGHQQVLRETGPRPLAGDGGPIALGLTFLTLRPQPRLRPPVAYPSRPVLLDAFSPVGNVPESGVRCGLVAA